MTTLIRIGNSQGVRIPKAIIEQAKLADKELSFKVTDAGLLIKPIVKTPRDGWQQAFASAQNDIVDLTDKEWIEAPLTHSNDDEQWVW